MLSSFSLNLSRIHHQTKKKKYKIEKIVNITGAWRGAVEWFPKMTSLPPRE